MCGNKPKKSNVGLALNLAAFSLGMLMLAYASVPLYRLFCQVTGYGGTTSTASLRSVVTSERRVVVRFNAETDPRLPWEFKPVEHSVRLRIGENMLIHYRARNVSDKPVTARAVYNVVPFKAGVYFDKIECFCFKNQTLAPGQEVYMPVSFFLDPALLSDPEMAQVKEITLSYTFFPAVLESKQ